MRFSLQREVLLKPLAQVVNVVERRHMAEALTYRHRSRLAALV